MKYNQRVIAQVDLMRARAADSLARLEAAQRSSTTIGGSTASFVTRQRSIKELRDQVEGWTSLLSVARGEDQTAAEGLEKEFPEEQPAPARTVAGLSEGGCFYSNRHACYQFASGGLRPGSLTEKDFADGSLNPRCTKCGKDVRR